MINSLIDAVQTSENNIYELFLISIGLCKLVPHVQMFVFIFLLYLSITVLLLFVTALCRVIIKVTVHVYTTVKIFVHVDVIDQTSSLMSC